MAEKLEELLSTLVSILSSNSTLSAQAEQGNQLFDQKRAIEKFRRSFNVVLVIKGETPANAMADAKAGKIDLCK